MRIPRSIFSEKRNFGEHDAAIKALRQRAFEIMQKVAMAKKNASPATQVRQLAEVKALQGAASYLASLKCPSVQRKLEARKMAMAA